MQHRTPFQYYIESCISVFIYFLILFLLQKQTITIYFFVQLLEFVIPNFGLRCLMC